MEQLEPVLLGADMNCYSMARAFHEAYGVKSLALGRGSMGETQYSRIVRPTVVENLDTDAVLVDTLLRHAKANPGPVRVALGCTDDYAHLLIRNRQALEESYIVPYIGAQLAEKLVDKDRFYECCGQFGIDCPDTVVLRGAQELDKLDALPFAYPVILKPASSINYWKHEFAGMKKVYAPESAGLAREIAAAIYASGYPGALIIQDLIPGADDRMRVLTAYCDQYAKVKMMCLGHVLLEEHTPRALGNHAAILTEYNEALMERLKGFLEAVGYTGFANFDIKYDERDAKYKVFELNLRQGRSNYYVTGAGLNLARYLVEDRVYGQDLGAPLLYSGLSYWHSIPNSVVYAYTGSQTLADKAMDIAKSGRDTTALGYAYDLRFNLRRRLYLWEHNRRYHRKYATYCKKVR